MILFITHQLQHNTPRPCQTSRCSDLYDRYIPGYISTSASSAGDSSGQQHNRTNTIIEHQLIDYENNQIEKKIIASKGAELVSYLHHKTLMIVRKLSYDRLALDKIVYFNADLLALTSQVQSGRSEEIKLHGRVNVSTSLIPSDRLL